MFETADLRRAEARLRALEERLAREGEGSDTMGRTIANARAHVKRIRDALDRPASVRGSAEADLAERLDAAFPNPGSRQVVSFEGRLYRCRYLPEATNAAGRVTRWTHRWEPVAQAASGTAKLGER